MINKLPTILTGIAIWAFASMTEAQAPTLGTAANFSLFSTSGAVTNTGLSQITGNVGSNNGPITGFGNVNGVMHSSDGATAQCATDLLIAYGQLDNAVTTNSPAPSLGSGQTLLAGVHSISGNTTINGILTLNAQNDPNAVFIFRIQGTLSSGAAAKINLINEAKACNVFWKVEGAVNLASGTFMCGTIIANNAAIDMTIGDTLQGRAFSTAGAITLNGTMAYTPIGCGSPALNGPTAPQLGATACYGLFSSNGAISNTGATYVTGDVGSNSDDPTGYNAAFVNGTIHLSPDGSTAQCASDLLLMYNYVNALPYDIELLYPAQFGNNLVLTPHTYLMNAAATLTDTVYLNAMDNADAIFIIQINGALTTGTNSNIVLMNGAQSKNVYWKVEGAADISTNSIFRGTLICNNAAIGNSGVLLDGRALITTGALSTNASIAIATMIPTNCATLGLTSLETANIISFYPNPFSSYTTVEFTDASMVSNSELVIYDMLGAEQFKTTITGKTTSLDTNRFPSGVYYYKLMNSGVIIQTGKLTAQ
ncbi:ice-binding family protein [Fluviicola sp.]|uniref:ice-binding family protein n=1 Tax=Fluviicola sp. TaxID=1917219 RepID=UPI003D2AB4B2